MLETGNRFEALIQWKLAIFNSWQLPFLNAPYSPFQKSKTLESSHSWLLNNWIRTWKRTWNLAPVLQIVQKILDNYCHCLYLSAGQVCWNNELWFKRYIQKCTLSHVLILIMTSPIWYIMRLLKTQNLNLLRMEDNLSPK